jgi:CRISPR-associated protein Cmr1
MNSITLAGADGTTPELRPASIKGALRFWWRAMNGHLEWKEMAELEGKIFGDTKQRSSLIIMIEETLSQVSKTSLLPHKGGSVTDCFPISNVSNLQFKIRLSLTNEASGLNFEQMKSLFILTCVLGGLGKRSRRGFGSFKIKKSKLNDAEYQEFVMPTTIDEIYAFLPKAYFEKANNTIYSNFRRNEPYPYLKSIEIGINGFSTHNELLTKIGSSSSTAKRENNDSWDYKNSLGHTSKRFASPCYVSSINVEGKFYPIFTTLNIASERGNNAPRMATDIQNAFKSRIQ